MLYMCLSTHYIYFAFLHCSAPHSNWIEYIEDQDTQLRDLEELNISKNQIKTLPENFLCGLCSLKTLNASMNEICKHQCYIHVHVMQPFSPILMSQ